MPSFHLAFTPAFTSLVSKLEFELPLQGMSLFPPSLNLTCGLVQSKHGNVCEIKEEVGIRKNQDVLIH